MFLFNYNNYNTDSYVKGNSDQLLDSLCWSFTVHMVDCVLNRFHYSVSLNKDIFLLHIHGIIPRELSATSIWLDVDCKLVRLH
jgi:hypothetical protein